MALGPAHSVDVLVLPSPRPLQDVTLVGKLQVGVQLQVIACRTLVVGPTNSDATTSVSMALRGFARQARCDRDRELSGGNCGPRRRACALWSGLMPRQGAAGSGQGAWALHPWLQHRLTPCGLHVVMQHRRRVVAGRGGSGG